MGPLKILLVEDNVLLRWWMQGNLEREGYFVVAPTTAEEALGVARAYPFDVLITDWRLGQGHDGFELLEALRLAGPPVLAVLVSANADDALAARGRAAGFDLVIRKPFPVGEILAAVQGLEHPGAGSARDKEKEREVLAS